MKPGRKYRRLMVFVVAGLISLAVKAQSCDSVLTVSLNPFATQTIITINNLSSDTVTLKIHNSFGSIVAVLCEDTIITGTLTKTFYADTLPNGFYLVRMTLNSVDHSCIIFKDSTLNAEFRTNNNELTVYPNPAYDRVFIKSQSEIKEIRIFDCYGKEVLEPQRDNYNGIDLTDLKKGVYLLHITIADKLFTDKVLKQ